MRLHIVGGREKYYHDHTCRLKVIQCQIRPYNAKKGHTMPQKAIQGHIRPCKAMRVKSSNIMSNFTTKQNFCSLAQFLFDLEHVPRQEEQEEEEQQQQQLLAVKKVR